MRDPSTPSSRNTVLHPSQPWFYSLDQHKAGESTFRWIAAVHGYHKQVRRHKPFINAAAVNKRLHWTKEKVQCGWESITSSDECSLWQDVLDQPNLCLTSRNRHGPKRTPHIAAQSPFRTYLGKTVPYAHFELHRVTSRFCNPESPSTPRQPKVT